MDIITIVFFGMIILAVLSLVGVIIEINRKMFVFAIIFAGFCVLNTIFAVRMHPDIKIIYNLYYGANNYEEYNQWEPFWYIPLPRDSLQDFVDPRLNTMDCPVGAKCT